MSDGGKGDKPRPISIPQKDFDNRWDEIFKPKHQTNTENPIDFPKEKDSGTDKVS